MSHFLSTLRTRMALVEQRVTAACQRAARPRSDVTIVPVTKSLSVEGLKLAIEAGLDNLGENRPQEFWKRAAAAPNITWHFIGHLQRNKIEKTLPLASLIHSVDTIRLLVALDAEAGKQNRVSEVLLEVNASGEASKHGFSPEDARNLADAINATSHLKVRGLMTMAEPHADPEKCRPTFATLRSLRDYLAPRVLAGHEFRELSMGMTGDFEVAIEEGATFVRLGSVYFEGLEAS